MGRILILIGAIVAAGAAEGQVVLGQADTFQSGSLAGWGGGASPNNIASGGPLGSGDRYLRIDSSSSGKLATYNDAQWSGNYAAAAVTAIEADLRNEGSTNLLVRLVLHGPNNAKFSSGAVHLPAGSAWTHVRYELQVAGFTQVVPGATFASTLGSLWRLMIRHDADPPTSNGSNIIGRLGIDNVHAVPEPGSGIALGSAALLAIAAQRLKDTKRRQP